MFRPLLAHQRRLVSSFFGGGKMRKKDSSKSLETASASTDTSTRSPRFNFNPLHTSPIQKPDGSNLSKSIDEIPQLQMKTVKLTHEKKRRKFEFDEETPPISQEVFDHLAIDRASDAPAPTSSSDNAPSRKNTANTNRLSSSYYTSRSFAEKEDELSSYILSSTPSLDEYETAKEESARDRRIIKDSDPILKIKPKLYTGVVDPYTQLAVPIETEDEETIMEGRILNEELKKRRERELADDVSDNLQEDFEELDEDIVEIMKKRPTTQPISDEESVDNPQKTVDMTQISPQQRHLLWEDRKRVYGILQRKILIALESHHTMMDKALLLIELHDLAIQQRLRLRSGMYEDILFTIFTAIPLYGNDTNMKPSRGLMFQTEAWTIYQYAVDSGTDPTPSMIQNMMQIIALVPHKNPTIEARAHKLMLDVDRFKLRPTPYSLTSYYMVCSVNSAMHLAVARFLDAKKRLEIPSQEAAVSAILSGFRRAGDCDGGLRFLATVSNVTITTSLLETVLHCARGSSNPLSALTFYRSMISSGCEPNHKIISTLLFCQEETNNYTNTLFILKEMVKYRIRCGTAILNKLLEALVKVKAKGEFVRIAISMKRHHKNIFAERYPAEYLDAVRAAENVIKSRDKRIEEMGGINAVKQEAKKMDQTHSRRILRERKRAAAQRAIVQKANVNSKRIDDRTSRADGKH